MINEIQNQLARLSCPKDGLFLQRFFKTGPGQYGEGDLFRGIRVSVLRGLAKTYQTVSMEQARYLLQSAYHEDRMLALLILMRKYAGGEEALRVLIYELYLGHTTFINNWDLVDVSAEHIVGAYLFGKDPEPLWHLARSSALWERRISILATFYFIRRGQFEATLKLAGILLKDTEDLIHKAVGWMLREVGKRDLAREEAFLALHYRHMPRTMLRYAIEKFPAELRLQYLKGEIDFFSRG